jgi:hypothetical protein
MLTFKDVFIIVIFVAAWFLILLTLGIYTFGLFVDGYWTIGVTCLFFAVLWLAGGIALVLGKGEEK